MSWNNHIDVLMNKLSTACYIIRNAITCMSASSLKMTYYPFFHSVMSYGIIFWGNLSHSSTIFSMKKKAIRIMEGCGNRFLWTNLFKKLQILPLISQYILSCLMYKIAIYIKCSEKNVLYVNPCIFLSLLSLSQFAYI